jgi:hypothetical protein
VLSHALPSPFAGRDEGWGLESQKAASDPASIGAATAHLSPGSRMFPRSVFVMQVGNARLAGGEVERSEGEGESALRIRL